MEGTAVDVDVVPESALAPALDLDPVEPPAPAPTKPLNELTEDERFEWRKTGVKPPIVAAPAADDALPPTVETPAPPRVVSKRQQQINDYERRIAEQTARIAALETRTPAPPWPKAPVESDAAPPVARAKDFERYKAMPDAPKLDTFESYEDWNIEMAAFVADRRYEERQQQETQVRQHEAAQRGLQDAATTWSGRLTTARQDRADFDTITGAFLDAVRIGTPIGDAVFTSEVGPDLAVHFGEHPEDFQRIARLHPAQQLRELGKLEATYAPAAHPQADLHPNPVTSAPAPPFTLGHRPGAPVDAVASALKRRDTGAYIREMNARDLATHKR